MKCPGELFYFFRVKSFKLLLSYDLHGFKKMNKIVVQVNSAEKLVKLSSRK